MPFELKRGHHNFVQLKHIDEFVSLLQDMLFFSRFQKSMRNWPLTSHCPSCIASTWKCAGPTLSTVPPSSPARWRPPQGASRNWFSRPLTPRSGQPSIQTVSRLLTGHEESCFSPSPSPSYPGSSETPTLTGTMTLHPACSCSSSPMKLQKGWKAP